MYLGIDIGGTNVKFGVIDENYNILKKYSIPTDAKREADGVSGDIIGKALEIAAEYPIELIGMGCPGRIDSAEGICVSAGNLPFKNYPLRAIVEDATGIPTYLGNDARCAVCGELYAGAGRECDNFVMITLGTGVGGGVVINKTPYLGRAGGAGEIGHITVDINGERCKCGQIGCLEHYASVTALVAQTRAAAEKEPDSILGKMCEKGVSGRTAFDAKRAGCPVGAEVVDRYIGYVAVGVVNASRMLQPDLVVIGGAISNEGDNLIIPLREKVGPRHPVVASELRNDAGLIGAVAMALRNG